MHIDLSPLAPFVLVLWGLMYLMVTSVIFAPVRITLAHGSPFRTTLVYCASCSGFWMGGALGWMGYWPYAYGLRGMIEASLAALVLGAIYVRWITPGSPLESEMSLLELPDDTKEENHGQ